jgi:hypothetical protein
VTIRQAIGIALSIIGVMVITGTKTPGAYPLSWLGNLLVLGAVVRWGIFTVQGKKMAPDHSWRVSTTAATCAAVLLSVPLAAAEVALEGLPPRHGWRACRSSSSRPVLAGARGRAVEPRAPLRRWFGGRSVRESGARDQFGAGVGDR